MSRAALLFGIAIICISSCFPTYLLMSKVVIFLPELALGAKAESSAYIESLEAKFDHAEQLFGRRF